MQRTREMECFLQCLLNGGLDYSWQGAAVNSRFRNAGLCFQNLNSGPGCPGRGAGRRGGTPEALGCQLHLLAGRDAGQRSGRKASGLFGWWMHLSWESACLLTRHKNIICSEEMDSHTNVMNLFLGDLVLFVHEMVCRLRSLVLRHSRQGLWVCSQACLGEYLSCSAAVGKLYHVSKGLEEDSCPLSPSWHSGSAPPPPDPSCHQASSVIICKYSWQVVDIGCVPKKGPCPQEGWGKKVILRLGLKFSPAFGEFSWGITLAHLRSTAYLKPRPNLFTHLRQPKIYRINMKFFLKFEELFFNVVLDLGNRNMVVFYLG